MYENLKYKRYSINNTTAAATIVAAAANTTAYTL